MSVGPRRGKSRRLSEEERTLWKDITRSIAPLRTTPPAGDPEGAPEAGTTDTAFSAAPAAAQPPSAKPAKPKIPPPLAPLGRRAKQRVARGKDAIDGRLDLHGLTQAEAHDALHRFLQTAQQRGAKLVVVITGKGGSRSGAESGSGVLKRQVPLWLKLPAFRAFVLGFEDADRVHGGAGALYVQVRRGRD
jgi:DNA-nicking Smr family endonuclease